MYVLQLTLNIGIIKLGQPLLDWLLLFNSFQLKHLKKRNALFSDTNEMKTPGDFLRLFKTLTTSVLSSQVERLRLRGSGRIFHRSNILTLIQVQVFHPYGTTLTVRNFSPPGGLLGLIFAGYVPQWASQNPFPIIVYSEAKYRPHLSHFWENVIFAISTQ